MPILLVTAELNAEQGRGAVELAAHLPGAEVAVLPGHGHFDYNEAPAVLAEPACRFLWDLK